MTREQEKQFYASILSGLLSNQNVGGTIDEKIAYAITIGDKLEDVLRHRRDGISHHKSQTVLHG